MPVHPTIEMLDTAIRIGEQRAAEMIDLAVQLQHLRRNLQRAIALLKCGQTANALRLLQSLNEEEKQERRL
jgi:hypothetical protein